MARRGLDSEFSKYVIDKFGRLTELAVRHSAYFASLDKCTLLFRQQSV